MTTGPLREIQILRAPAGERSYSAHYDREHLPRLGSCLADPDVDVETELTLTRDHRGQRLAQLVIDVRLKLACQRCLEAVSWSARLQNTLLLLTEDAPQAENEDQESILLTEGVLDLAALVEDEIMLALPLAPRHDDDSDCGRAWEQQQAQRDKPAGPFAALAALKSKH